jgi:hypothetical protein
MAILIGLAVGAFLPRVLNQDRLPGIREIYCTEQRGLIRFRAKILGGFNKPLFERAADDIQSIVQLLFPLGLDFDYDPT